MYYTVKLTRTDCDLAHAIVTVSNLIRARMIARILTFEYTQQDENYVVEIESSESIPAETQFFV